MGGSLRFAAWRQEELPPSFKSITFGDEMADTLITGMGLFWRADKVFRGSQKKVGILLGKPAKAKKSAEVDFRDQVGIYVLYADYELVYVGQTGKGNQKLLVRLRQHRSDDLADRWNRFSWFGIRRVLNNEQLSKEKEAFHPSLATALNHIEGVLIHTAEPPMNGQGGRFGKNVERYLQVPDKRLGQSVKEMLSELLTRDQDNRVVEKRPRRGRPPKAQTLGQ